MSLKFPVSLDFQAQARTELLELIDYYGDIRPALAQQFVAAVEHATALICAFPLSGRPSAAGTRKVMVKKFPFNVIYQVQNSRIVVVAIAHHSRKPGYWTGRL